MTTNGKHPDAWNVRRVRGATDNTWLFQPAAYTRRSRADGLPIWEVAFGAGEAHETEDAAVSDGLVVFGGLPRDLGAGHGRLALRMGDLLAPDEESEYRLGGVELYRVFYEQTRSGRFVLALGKRVEEDRPVAVRTVKRKSSFQQSFQTQRVVEWVLVRRLGIVTERQLEPVHKVGLTVERAIKIPRDQGKVIKS